MKAKIFIALSLLILAFSCKKEEENIATSLEIVSGNNQTIVMNKSLPDPIVMMVTDQNGKPISGTTVFFSVTEGSVSPTSAITDQEGKVSAIWTVGSNENNQIMSATAFRKDGVTPLSGSPVNVTATSLTPVKLEIVSGNNQGSVLGNVLENKIVVKIVDQYGNPFSGITVKFSANDNGSVSSATLTTDEEGKAAVLWTLGTALQTQKLTVTAFKTDGVSPLEGSPLNVTALVATSLELISGNNQSGEILSILQKPVVVQVKDQNGEALAGIPVVFEEIFPIGGGMYVPFFQVYDTTDAEGKAKHMWRLQYEQTLTANRKLNIMVVNEDSIRADGTPLITALATATALSTSVTDIEGNTYPILPYGDKVWMTSNLKTTKYNDGLTIPNITDKTGWINDKNGAYCWFNNNISYKEKCGALYNWYVIQTDKICPVGWHIPTDTEWKKLIDYLTAEGYGYGGSGSDIAKAMAASSGWSVMQQVITHAGEVANDITSNNSSGFSAYPTGLRILDVDGETGYYDFILDYAVTYFWTHDNIGNDIWGKPASKCYNMSSTQNTVDQTTRPHYSGNSIRCVRD